MDDRRPRPNGRPSRNFVPDRPISVDGTTPQRGVPPMGLRRQSISVDPSPPPAPSVIQDQISNSVPPIRSEEQRVPVDHQLPEKNRAPNRRSRKKIIFIILLILVIAVAIFFFVIKPKFLDKEPKTSTNAASVAPIEEAKKPTGTFRLIGLGDIITHDSVNQAAKKPDGSYDYAPMFSEIAPLLAKTQARVCHNTVPTAGGAISGYPSFNAPPELISGLVSSGCNVMSLASDHINDKEQPAIDATRAAIDQQKTAVIATSGANRNAEEQAAEQYFNVGDGAVKVGYISYTTKQANAGSTPFGVNVYSRDSAKAQIDKMRKLTDIMVVSMCWGKEDSGDIQPDQDQIAQELADAGIDVVFGHCPHFVQPVKLIKSGDGGRETVVYYSLGNTLNSQLPIEALIGGMAVVDIDVETKKIASTGFTPTYMHYEWSAAEKAAKKLDARKNLKLYPLDAADAVLASSQNGTTAAAQTARVTEILNKYTPIKIVPSTQY